MSQFRYGLARAVGSEKTRHVSWTNHEAQIVNRGEATEALDEALHRYHSARIAALR